MGKNHTGTFCIFVLSYRRTKEKVSNNPKAEYVFIEVHLMKNCYKLTRNVSVKVMLNGGIMEDKTRVESLSVACIIRGI